MDSFVSLTDNNETSGGLVIVPDSHKRFIELQSTTNEKHLGSDFVQVKSENPIFQESYLKC